MADDAWANFARNHDEWSLDKLTEAERQEVFNALRPQGGHAALRPRLASPHADHAEGRRGAHPPGLQPGLRPARARRSSFYGEEIGMAENLDPGPDERARADAVVGSNNGGFSTASPKSCADRSSKARSGARPRQRRQPAARSNSMLNWMERLIRRRRETPRSSSADGASCRFQQPRFWRCGTIGARAPFW
jgi:hypothetical protein